MLAGAALSPGKTPAPTVLWSSFRPEGNYGWEPQVGLTDDARSCPRRVIYVFQLLLLRGYALGLALSVRSITVQSDICSSLQL